MIFGTVLPYIGFREVSCEADGGPIYPHQKTPWRIQIFVVGWLGWGMSMTLPRTIRYVG